MKLPSCDVGATWGWRWCSKIRRFYNARHLAWLPPGDDNHGRRISFSEIRGCEILMRASSGVGLLLASSMAIFGIYGRQQSSAALPPGPEPVWVNGQMGVYNPDTGVFVPSTSPLFDQTCDLIRLRRAQAGGYTGGPASWGYHHYRYNLIDHLFEYPGEDVWGGGYSNGGTGGGGYWGGASGARSSGGSSSFFGSARGGIGETGHAFGGSHS